MYDEVGNITIDSLGDVGQFMIDGFGYVIGYGLLLYFGVILVKWVISHFMMISGLDAKNDALNYFDSYDDYKDAKREYKM